MKLLLYCTKAKPYIMKYKDGKYKEIASIYTKQDLATCDLLNGKIIAECDFEIEEITIGRSYGFTPNLCIISTKNLQPIELLSKSCYENYDDLFKYLKYDFDNDYGTHKGPYGYAIHIKNLHIFDVPREIKDYRTYNRNGKVHIADIPIYTAPQNMMYAFDYYGNSFILISIKPQWLCKILNGEKTIEVRKKVLKEMLK